MQSTYTDKKEKLISRKLSYTDLLDQLAMARTIMKLFQDEINNALAVKARAHPDDKKCIQIIHDSACTAAVEIIVAANDAKTKESQEELPVRQ